MNDPQTGPETEGLKGNNKKSRYPETPEEAMMVWKQRIDEIPPVNYGETRERLLELTRIRIPDVLLRPEGYIKLIGKLQAIRGEALEIRARVNEHCKLRTKAVRSLQAIFPGMSERKTVQQKEAEAENWLIYVQRSLANYEALKETAGDAVDHASRTLADVVQQLKAINQYGVPTGLLDTSQAVEISYSWLNIDENEEDSEINAQDEAK